ncbi:hypothetical protein APS56_13740 [Pseudalgibacter alginicilyticus]|uniref:Secretion system C-terminal sorting domain-containing protein n=1 Tax=Pseudalgibacter alginicilyticus TaxID=1736674 RepID=A0A0P0D5D6_9FLAO|nr:T9SS type A sorting domain-containing protein [Pseudalgibacter alginicilyticus]ALJ06124.1 hypothetical protein APS56_13740 [Pseudalgibacter alginicilyticus]
MKTKLFICMVLTTALMQAQTIYVSSTGDNTDGSSWGKAYSSIQAALFAATSGNEIWVQQGTYVIAVEAEQLNFKEGVNVYGGFTGTETTLAERSEDASLTVISHDAGGAGDFRLLTSESLITSSTWDGFTFDGKDLGTGIFLNGNCNLNNVIVENCKVTDGGGAGVYIGTSEELAPVSVTNSVITNNTIVAGGVAPVLSGGAGIYAGSSSNATLIENCTVSENIISCDSASASNDNRLYGAGIFIVQGVIRNSTISNNQVAGPQAGIVRTGGGICILPVSSEDKTVDIDGCSITGNSSTARGGAVLIDPSYSGEYGGTYTITNSNFINNSSSNVGGALFCTSSATSSGWEISVINSIFANNSATTGGAFFMNTPGTVKIIYSTFVNNSASSTYGGGGVAINGDKIMGTGSRITNSIFWGNTQNGATPARTQLSSGLIPTITNCAIQEYDAGSSYWANATMSSIVNLGTDNTDVKFLAPTASAGNTAPDVDESRWQITDDSVCIEWGIDEKYSDGTDILIDYAGKARALSSSTFIYPDLGAYQFDASNPPVLNVEDIVKSDVDFKIYPTVANSTLFVKTNKSIKEIEIYNINGSSVLKTNNVEEVNVSSLSSGLYLFRATFNDNMTAVKRFIKN